MSDMIDDNRFVLIKKYKRKLIEGTNISDRPKEMAVLDSILFRFWQMGWLDKLEEESRWIPCSERLPEERQEILATTTDNAWGDVVIIRTYYKEMHKSVIAWMPLPEPYAERRTDDCV